MELYSSQQPFRGGTLGASLPGGATTHLTDAVRAPIFPSTVVATPAVLNARSVTKSPLPSRVHARPALLVHVFLSFSANGKLLGHLRELLDNTQAFI